MDENTTGGSDDPNRQPRFSHNERNIAAALRALPGLLGKIAVGLLPS
ncbi:MAG: hypothetical protein ACOYEV_01465 [Candidatus Nanopelagicales bacterium]